jgi:predicted lactoylglutathione lyase
MNPINKKTIQDCHILAQFKGGKCLSTEYVNGQKHLLWECKEFHTWNTSYSSIQKGRWCPECAGVKKKNIQDYINVAESKGGQFISNEIPQNVNTDCKWECNQGHSWSASYNDIKSRNNWCPHCLRISIKDYKMLAESKGGKFISNEIPKNVHTKCMWQCNEGHSWEAVYSNISQGSWCPRCAGSEKKTIKDYYILAESRGFKFLSTEVNGVNNKYLWECVKGHQWNATRGSIKKGHGCPSCCGLTPKNIEDVKKIAEDKGGKCLSNEIKNSKQMLKFQCDKKHVWNSNYNRLQQGNWCPFCADKTYGEKLTRCCFEKMLRCDFKKIKPNWMRNHKTGRKLELDGYNEQMGIAFEHQGIQHEKHCPKSYQFYNPEQLVRDEIKRQKCKERGIILIEVPEIGRRLKLKDVVPFLLSEFDKHNIAYPESAKSFQIDMKEFYAEYMNQKSTTGVDDFLSELDALDFSDDSLFEDSIVDEVNNLDFDDPELFN